MASPVRCAEDVFCDADSLYMYCCLHLLTRSFWRSSFDNVASVFYARFYAAPLLLIETAQRAAVTTEYVALTFLDDVRVALLLVLVALPSPPTMSGYSTSGPVSTGMDYCPRASMPPRRLNQPSRPLSHLPSMGREMSTGGCGGMAGMAHSTRG